MKGDVFLCCFGLGKKDSDSSELPQIVITFHEENPGGNNNTRDSILEPGVDFGASRSLYTPSIGQIKPKPVANNDDLSKAHEEVINQMRKALKEARGGDLQNKNQDNQNNTLTKGDLTATDKATAQTGQQPPSKPPVPPTKALAVAKIRAAIAQAKQDGGGTIQLPPPPAESENCDTLNSKTSADIDNKITTKQNSNQENPPNHFSSLPPKATADPTQNLIPPKKQSAVGVPNQTVNKKQFPNIPTIQITVPNENNTEQSDNNKPNIKTGEANSEKQQNKEIVIGKLKAAIFAAAALESEKNRVNINGMNYNPPKFGVNTAKDNTTSPGGKTTNKSQLPPSKPVEKKPVIFDFFEEKGKKRYCRTCGYCETKKTHTGNLVRHLSLVHQREYKIYNMRIKSNWTDSMLEKNLNMRLPSNF